ncbi:MAG: nitrous oxide reductase accessory protein NosL [Candidatus Promineifilaceae bacterium]
MMTTLTSRRSRLPRRATIAWLFLALVTLLAFSACRSEPEVDTPPEIRYGEDTCDRCQMIINEARYASAYVTADGQTRRFDDIGGMVAFSDETGENVSAYWVHDYDSESWLKADQSLFVMSVQEPTPMGFGIVAFSSRERAESWASEHSGMVMTFAELIDQDLDQTMEHQQS